MDQCTKIALSVSGAMVLFAALLVFIPVKRDCCNDKCACVSCFCCPGCPCDCSDDCSRSCCKRS